MWVLKKINQEQDFASGKFSSQSQLAEFLGIHPRTLNKALKEDRNSFQFRGEMVSVHQLPEFSAEDSSGNQRFFEKEAQIVEFFGVSRQTVYLAFKTANKKVFKKDGVKWTVTRLLQDEVPICKNQRSQSFKVTSNSTLTLTSSVPDQRSHTLKPSSSNPRKRIPRPPPKTPEEILKQGQEEAEEEERIRDERISCFLHSQRPWFLVPPTFPFPHFRKYVLFNPDTNTEVIVKTHQDVMWYFEDQGLDVYFLSEEQFNNHKRPVWEFIVDFPEGLDPQYWKRYFLMVPPWDLESYLGLNAKSLRKKLSKPPSASVAEVLVEV